MTEELLLKMDKVIRNNLPDLIAALRLFGSDAEFIFPRNQGDLINNRDKLLSQVNAARAALKLVQRDGIEGIEETRIDLSFLVRGEYVSRDRVGGVIPYRGEVEIYELTQKGKELFMKRFPNITPKMCSQKHWASSG